MSTENGAAPVRDLQHTYVHLGTGPEVRLLEVTPEFWATLDDRPELHTGRLVTEFTMDADWSVWEMHPAGDELIVFTEGSVRVRFDDGSTATDVDVSAPQFVVVPAGVWHTMDVVARARMIVITWGEGTDHRPRT